MTSRYTNLFRFFFVCVDLIALNLVNIVLMLSFRRIPAEGEREYGILFLVSNMIWLVSAYGARVYIEDAHPELHRFVKRTLKAFILYVTCVLLFVFLYHYFYSRLFVVLSFVFVLVSLIVTRLGLIGVTLFFKSGNRNSRRIVIVGYNDLANKFVRHCTEHRHEFHVDGYFEDKNEISELTTLPIIGNIDECLEYATKNNIHEIYSTISPEFNKSIYAMATMAEKSLIRVKFIPDFKLFVNRETYVEYQDHFPILSLRPEPLEDLTNSVKKRIFDIIFSLLIIVFLLSWLIPVLALIIKATSKGPVIFKQKRSGRHNKQFTCYKLRTLRMNVEANTKQVTLNDNRITRVGRFLRKSNLDELPQFLNVLLGNMSVVGPRPHMLAHTDLFSKLMGEYMVRHFLKPGITGWAQVMGYRGEIKEETQLRNRIIHDIWYMENWSLWLDAKIIWLTIYSTFKGNKNAY
jgi:putative colanic acid biosysnthesis UDP-glucose lipid carrier transferase